MLDCQMQSYACMPHVGPIVLQNTVDVSVLDISKNALEVIDKPLSLINVLAN